MRRGRPRHDDILTPREWEVLELLRRGFTNAEIADRLGVTRDTAKFHVSEIITKLGVENREAAAAWRGRPRVALGIAPLMGLLQRVAAVSPWKLAAGGGVAAGSAVLGVLLVGILVSGSTQSTGVPVDTVTVRWIEEEPPPPVSWEALRPFADLVAPGTPDVWRAYVVEGNGAPKLLTETSRYIYDVTWSNDETAVLNYSTRQRDSEGVIGTIIHGASGVSTSTAEVKWDRINDHERVWPAPSDGRLSLMPYPGRLYVTEPGESSFRLEGLMPWTANLWSPDGKYLIVTGSEGTDSIAINRPFFSYIITPGDPIALKLATSLSPSGNVLPRPSPDGSLLMYPEGDHLAIVDVESRTIRRLSIDLRDAVRTAVPSWSADGRFISFGEAVIDVENGTQIRPAAPATKEVSSRLSPDGHWLVASSSPYVDDGEQPDCRLITGNFGANRTRIIDMRAGSEREILTCADKPYAPWKWVDESHVLLTGFSCTRCDEPVRRDWLLLDARNGSFRTLATDTGEGFAFDVRESDGRILVGGNVLHIYEADGRPTGRIASPDGQPVQHVAWSPDGGAFVFVTGPEADLSQFYGGP